MTPELHDKLVKALEIALDLATTEFARVKSDHEWKDINDLVRVAREDIKIINEALALLEKEHG